MAHTHTHTSDWALFLVSTSFILLIFPVEHDTYPREAENASIIFRNFQKNICRKFLFNGSAGVEKKLLLSTGGMTPINSQFPRDRYVMTRLILRTHGARYVRSSFQERRGFRRLWLRTNSGKLIKWGASTGPIPPIPIKLDPFLAYLLGYPATSNQKCRHGSAAAAANGSSPPSTGRSKGQG